MKNASATVSANKFDYQNLLNLRTQLEQEIQDLEFKIKNLNDVKKYTSKIKDDITKLEKKVKGNKDRIEDIDKVLTFKPGDWVRNGSTKPGKIIEIKRVGNTVQTQVLWWQDRVCVPVSLPRLLSAVPKGEMEYIWTGENYPKLIRKIDKFECEDISLLQKEQDIALEESENYKATYCKKRIQLLKHKNTESNTSSHTKLDTILKFCTTTKPEIKFIPISDIRCDGNTQQRVSLNHEVVAEYAEAMKAGEKFPPIKVKYDGDNYWLFDGFHTLEAAYSIASDEIKCEVTQGSQRDAILESVGVNAKHGLRRTNADKRKAVTTLLTDEEWNHWSDREIARRCNVDHKTVGKIRYEFTINIPSEKIPSSTPDDIKIITGEIPSNNLKTYKDKYGNTSLMNTKNIGGNISKEEKGKAETISEIEGKNNKIKGEAISPPVSSSVCNREMSSGDHNKKNNHNQKKTMTTLREKISLGDIVIVNPQSRTDSRLTLYKGNYAKVTALHKHSADIQIWDKKIETVAITDLQPSLENLVCVKASLTSEELIEIMSKFNSLEDALRYSIRN